MSEDLKQTPPASIESDAPSEYMRGYSDGLAQAEETIAAAIQRAKAEERAACAKVAREAQIESEGAMAKAYSDEYKAFHKACAKAASLIEFRMKLSR